MPPEPPGSTLSDHGRVVLIAGAAGAAVLLAAILLDAVVSARGPEPAPRHFSLFLGFFLALEVATFCGRAVGIAVSGRREGRCSCTSCWTTPRGPSPRS